MRRYKKIAFIPDIHVPYQDDKAVSVARQFIRHYKPNTVIFLGDVLYMYGLARFDNKDPKRIGHLNEEIEQAFYLLRDFREDAPNADFFFIQGNHEYRLKKYIRNNAPELHNLPGLDLATMLNLDHLQIEYVESGRMEYNGILVKHGDKVRARSGYTATGELESVGLSGISGHTHRLGQIYKTNRSGMFTWIEAGCLCDMQPEWVEGRVMDWQHGLAYGTYTPDKDKRFEIHTLPIINNKILFEGVEIKA